MKGYHYLMRLAHTLNILAIYSTALIKIVRSLGVRAFIEFLRETLAGPWLDRIWVRERLNPHIPTPVGLTQFRSSHS